MGQQPNKYQIADDGIVYRINEDGSFTSIGNIEDIEKKPSSSSIDKMPPIPTPIINSSDAVEVGWWKRNYNWLWVIILSFFIGWFISCLSCAWVDYPIYYENGDVSYYSSDNSEEISVVCLIILCCFLLSWYLSTKNKTWIKLIQIPLVVFPIWIALSIYWLCEQKYSFLLLFLGSIPFALWTVAVCLSVFKLKQNK